MTVSTPAASPRARAWLSDASHVRTLMLRTGAALLPMGLLVIGLGWYGTANTPYLHDQVSYVVSGGLFGLGLVLIGGFLLFGAWLAEISERGRDSSAHLIEALKALTDAQAVSAAASAPTVGLVTAGKGTTVHRADCGLIAAREDLMPVGGVLEDLTPCRVCRPLASPSAEGAS